MAPPSVVQVTALAAGGEGVGRLEDGRAVFVAGALPGETVRITVVQEKRRWARARLVDVVTPSVERVAVPCRWHRVGCGGCDLMQASAEARARARLELTREALERLGRVAEPVVVEGPALPDTAVRTTLRVAVLDGRAALRRRSSHELVGIEDCLVAHPALQELLADGRFGGASEITLRVGAATGERMVVAAPSARGVVVPRDVVVVGADELAGAGAGAGGGGDAGGSRGRGHDAGPRDAHIHDVVAARRWRISAGSFFQASAAGAEALVATVTAAVGGPSGSAAPAVALDAYCGVGLLCAALPDGAEVVAVESAPSSVGDAEHNLADRPVRVVRSRFERWRPEPVEVAVADPSRRGLGRAGVEVLAATGAGVIVLVSCDVAALGRDSADLGAAGYRHVRSAVLDLFPQTAHAEVVTRFERR